MRGADNPAQNSDAKLRAEAIRTRGVGPLSFSLSASECVCVTGESGAGKSLLLRAIADLDPHDGNVYLNDVLRREFPPTAWRRRVGLLPPESAWWEDKVSPHFVEVDEALLDAVGFGSDVMEWSVSRLSSGERQRLALVRLLCNGPEVLLLDEPTANLDPVNVQRVEAMIERRRGEHGVAVIWVSHDPVQIARVASRELKLTEGKMTELPKP